MGGGKPILTLTPTCAIVGRGTTLTNAKSIAPKSTFFMLSPPVSIIYHRLYSLRRLPGCIAYSAILMPEMLASNRSKSLGKPFVKPRTTNIICRLSGNYPTKLSKSALAAR
jgi:hypothetical protein